VNRRLFEDLVVSARGRKPRARLAWPASVGIHAAVVAVAVIASVFGPGDLVPEVTARPAPITAWPTVVTAPPVLAPRPMGQPTRPRGGRPRFLGPSLPTTAPAVAVVPGDPPPEAPNDDVLPPGDGCQGPECLVGSSIGPGPGDDTGGGGGGGPVVVHAGGDITPPVKVRNVSPVYPEPARRAGVGGMVIVECVIDPKGNVVNARVLRGHPLLDRAALDAVQQWSYRPTRLNGAPVSVIMTVTVYFTIAR